MAEEQITAGSSDTNPTSTNQPSTEATPAAAQNTDTADRDGNWIPKHRFDEVNRELKDLRSQLDTQARAQAKAEEERLAKAQEWEQIAEKRQARISELEPSAELAAELSTLISEQIEAEIADWPDEVKAMAPEGADPRAMLKWLQQARPLAARLTEPAPAPGNAAGPKPANGAVASQKRLDELRQQALVRIRNQF